MSTQSILGWVVAVTAKLLPSQSQTLDVQDAEVVWAGPASIAIPAGCS